MCTSRSLRGDLYFGLGWQKFPLRACSHVTPPPPLYCILCRLVYAYHILCTLAYDNEAFCVLLILQWGPIPSSPPFGTFSPWHGSLMSPPSHCYCTRGELGSFGVSAIPRNGLGAFTGWG